MSSVLPYLDDAAAALAARFPGRKPLAFVRSYGCQQNVADGETIKGVLSALGFGFCTGPDMADLVLFNTCAVREHAEDRVYGNLGALKSLKRERPEMLIAVCGCMPQQGSVAEKLKKSYPFVDIVFGTGSIYKLPELIYRTISENRRVIGEAPGDGALMEDLPLVRDSSFRAWVPVMVGCDNFCSYCIVPYVRGREKSREPRTILRECEELIHSGYREINLLGQNVNSYGKGLGEGVDFPALLRMVDDIDGDFRLQFMTSHPKDATKELFDTMANSRHIPHKLHLPVQSGNDRVLRQMNRKYSREDYLSLVNYGRTVMPDLNLTSDIIVGFPGESYEEFQDTLSLVREVDFTNLFTFIFSPREGTAAAKMDDPIPHEEKARWLAELLKVQEDLAAKRGRRMLGKTERVLVEGREKKSGLLSGRTEGGLIVLFDGKDEELGSFEDVRITEAQGIKLTGESLMGS